MKKTIFSFAALLILAFAFPSCKKDKSFTDQLVGHWHSTEVKDNDADATAFYEFQLHLEASKEFDLDFITKNILTGGRTTVSSTGDWSQNDDKRDITLTYNTGETKTYEVKDLTEDVLRVEFIEGGKRLSIVFAKQ